MPTSGCCCARPGEGSHPGPHHDAGTARGGTAGGVRRRPGLARWRAQWQYLELADGGLAHDREEIRDERQAEIGCRPAGGRPRSRSAWSPRTGATGTRTTTLRGRRRGGQRGRRIRLLEYPIWYWLWAAPSTRPGGPGCAFRSSWRPANRQAKAAAMAAQHVGTGGAALVRAARVDEVLLPPAFLAHFERSWETFAWHPAASPAAAAAAFVPAASLGGDGGSRRSAPDDGAFRRYTAGDAERIFDAVHRGDEDPWECTTSWYSSGKRALTLAALPDEHYAAGLEVGCSTRDPEPGACAAVTASPSTPAAPPWRRPPSGLPRCPRRARFATLTVPQEWPDGRFDLIVIPRSAIIAPAELAGLFERVEARS